MGAVEFVGVMNLMDLMDAMDLILPSGQMEAVSGNSRSRATR